MQGAVLRRSGCWDQLRKRRHSLAEAGRSESSICLETIQLPLAMKPCLYKGWVYKPLIQEQTSSTVHDDKGLKVWLGLGLEEGSILQQRSHATVFHPDPDWYWYSELGQFATRRGSRLPTNACECGYNASTRPHSLAHPGLFYTGTWHIAIH